MKSRKTTLRNSGTEDNYYRAWNLLDAPVFVLLLAIFTAIPLLAILSACANQLILALTLSILSVSYELIHWLIVLRLAWLASHRPPWQPQPGKIPSIAIVIPAWNEAAALPKTLETLLNQNDLPERIIVADDGSSDRTITELKTLYQIEFQGDLGRSQICPRLQVLRKEHSGKGDSLNRGIYLSEEDVVLILDADTRLTQGSIAALRQTFTDYPHLSAVSGTLIPTCSHSWLGKTFQFFQRYEYARTHIWRLAWSYLNSSLIVSGACAAFRRDLLLEIGGFNPASWAEDYEIMFRLHLYLRSRQRTCRVTIQPRLCVYTEAPETIYAFLRQRRRWAGGFLETMLWYRKMIANRSLGILGCGYLVHNVYSIVSPFYPLAWIVAGLILFFYNPSTHIYLFLIIFALIAIAVIASILSLRLYRDCFHRREVSVGGGALELVLRPLFYLYLVIFGHLWGYLSCLRRQKTW